MGKISRRFRARREGSRLKFRYLSRSYLPLKYRRISGVHVCKYVRTLPNRCVVHCGVASRDSYFPSDSYPPHVRTRLRYFIGVPRPDNHPRPSEAGKPATPFALAHLPHGVLHATHSTTLSHSFSLFCFFPPTARRLVARLFIHPGKRITPGWRADDAAPVELLRADLLNCWLKSLAVRLDRPLTVPRNRGFHVGTLYR